jgi:hypothetical protein
VKKILFFCLLPLFCSGLSTLCDQQGDTVYDKQVGDKHRHHDRLGDADYDWAITIKNAYFYPQDCTLRQIFCQCGNKGGYWFEGAVRYNIWKRLDIEASGSYFGKGGWPYVQMSVQINVQR